MIMVMENIEANQYPNKGRQVGIDLAKCLAIIFMIIMHTLMHFDADENSTFYQIYDLIFGSILAAPVFMTAMGVGLAYSSKSTPKKIIFRGINIFIIAFILNVVRVIPKFIIAGVEKDSELLFISVFYNSICGDILVFAGLALILFGLLKIAKLKDYMILLIAVIFSLLVTLIPVFVTNNVIFNFLSGLLFPTMYGKDVNMVFPIMSWFIFPAFGYWFGNQLKKTSKPNLFYLVTGLVGAIIGVTGFILEDYLTFGFVGITTEMAFYGMKIYDALFCLGTTLALFALCHYISKISPLKLQKGYISMSNSLNLNYIIHYLIVNYISIPLTYYYGVIPLYAMLLVAVGIIIISTTLSILLKGYIKKKVSEDPHSLWRFINAA